MINPKSSKKALARPSYAGVSLSDMRIPLMWKRKVSVYPRTGAQKPVFSEAGFLNAKVAPYRATEFIIVLTMNRVTL